MELLTVIKCPAAWGCGGYCSAQPNPSIIGVRSSCVPCTPDICTLYALLCITIALRVLHFSAVHLSCIDASLLLRIGIKKVSHLHYRGYSVLEMGDTIPHTTHTNTSPCSINTRFFATAIQYLAHVMYFGLPGTCGTSAIPSEKLFSKAGEVVATRRSNIKPKNLLCFGIVQ